MCDIHKLFAELDTKRSIFGDLAIVLGQVTWPSAERTGHAQIPKNIFEKFLCNNRLDLSKWFDPGVIS